MARLRIGVLGCARIARGFVAGLRGSESVEVVAVASRDGARAAAFAFELGVPRFFGSYEELLRDPEVDAIYNPLPNALHAPWSIAAARAGKHVLCEKPLAGSAAEGREMFAAAAASGVFLLEAFPFHFQPQMDETLRLIAGGAIGAVQLVQASFGFPLDEPANVRWDPALGGGALLDVGCYPVSLARLVFGARPLRAGASARFTGRGVDLTLAGTLEYPGGGLAQIACSFGTGIHRRALIAGTSGSLETGYANHTDRADDPSLRLRRQPGWEAPVELVPVERANGFRREAEALARWIAEGDRAAEARHREASLDNLAAIDALLASARAGAPVQVER